MAHRRDPAERALDGQPITGLEYFTDREGLLDAFGRYLEAADEKQLRVLAFFGVGGIGKTWLLRKLAETLRGLEPPLPHARFDFENLRDHTQAYLEVLLRFRAELAREFHLSFPRFELCWAVIRAHQGGPPPPLIRDSPILYPIFEFLTGPVSGQRQALGRAIDEAMKRSRRLEEWLRRAGGTEEVIRLREMARQEDEALRGELIARFAQDLKEHLPSRAGQACRAALFLDSYEALWVGQGAGGSARAQMLDDWVRELAEYCLGSGILLVIGGRDRLRWDQDDPEWREELDQHLVGGLSPHDAQDFLAKNQIGPPAGHPPSRLQSAIILCCGEGADPDSGCHPNYLALCAETVQLTREKEGRDPSPSLFAGIPTADVARELTRRFLKSLPSEQMETWVKELSLTWRFDEQAAQALNEERQHCTGRAGWEQLLRFSFVQPQPDGFYRLHKTMRDALRAYVPDDQEVPVHEWFIGHWTHRGESALAWFHRWTLGPDGALSEWTGQHKAALRELRISDARALLTWWAEISLDDADRRQIGDTLWASTHWTLGWALWSTPMAPRQGALTAAIEHYEAALRVYTEAAFPQDWAMSQGNLGAAYADLPSGGREENLRQAIACYQAALRVWTEAAFPQDWARTLSNLAVVSEALFQVCGESRLLQQARNAFAAAMRGYAAVGLTKAEGAVAAGVARIDAESATGPEHGSAGPARDERANSKPDASRHLDRSRRPPHGKRRRR